MMLRDEPLNDLGELRLLPEPKPLDDVLDQDGRRGIGLQLVVGIPSLVLVFHEVVGLEHFSHVVVVQADPAEQAVSPDPVGGQLREVGHVDRVCVRTRSFQREATQKRCGRIRPFEECLVSRNPGEPLEHRHKAHREDRARHRISAGPPHRFGEFHWGLLSQEAHRKERRRISSRDDRNKHQRLRPATDNPDAHGGRSATDHHRKQNVQLRERRLSHREARQDKPHDQCDSGVPENRHRQNDKRHRQQLGRPIVGCDYPSHDEIGHHQSRL